jgi:hypothetical protein
MLEQRDRYNVGYYDNVLMGIQADRRRYQDLIDSVTCTDTPNAAGSEKKRGSENAAANQNAVPSAESTAPKSCADVKAAMYSHVVALSLTEDSVLFRKALLNDYYDKFIDGITERTPNIIPVMRILDAKSGLLALWARLPFEILEMFLLVCMGALGGVISVTPGFVDHVYAESIDPRLMLPARGRRRHSSRDLCPVQSQSAFLRRPKPGRRYNGDDQHLCIGWFGTGIGLLRQRGRPADRVCGHPHSATFGGWHKCRRGGGRPARRCWIGPRYRHAFTAHRSSSSKLVQRR